MGGTLIRKLRVRSFPLKECSMMLKNWDWSLLKSPIVITDWSSTTFFLSTSGQSASLLLNHESYSFHCHVNIYFNMISVICVIQPPLQVPSNKTYCPNQMKMWSGPNHIAFYALFILLVLVNPPVIALVEWQTAVVEAADLGLVVGDLSVVLQMETCVVQGESFDKRSVGRVARGSIGHAQAGDGQPLADDLLVPGMKWGCDTLMLILILIAIRWQ